MRVMFLSASRGVWGAEESLLTLAAAMKADGQHVELVCFPGSLAETWSQRVGTEVHTPGVAAPERESKLTENVRLWRCAMVHGGRHAHVVLFTYYLVLLAPLLRIAGFRIALDVHDYLARRRGRMILRGMAWGCRRIVAVSHFTATQFGSRRVSVLTRPVTERTLGTRVIGSGPMRVGVIGRLVPEKGHLVVNRAVELAIAAGADCELVYRGDDSLDPTYAAEVLADARTRLGDRFAFDGAVPAARVMKELDAVVVANPAEPMGRTVLEAQLSGVVAIVPESGGSGELVEDGQTGFHYRAADSASLASALAGVAGASSDLRQSARARALAATDPERYAREYLQAI